MAARFDGPFIEAVKRFNPDQSALFPFAAMVPRDVEENLEWRDWVAASGEDSQQRRFIFDACRRDLLFFINGFLWIKQESPVPRDLPFILWPKQEEYIRLLVETRQRVEQDQTGSVRGDVLSVKCREVGWTWLTLAEGFHMVLFTPGSTGLLGSRVEYDVDAPGSSKTLFWKLDYFAEHLPRWFMPEGYWNVKRGWPEPTRNRRCSLKMSVPGGGTILGSSTHENFGRSGRFAWMLLDEFAHTDRGQAGMGERIWAATTKTCRMRRVVSSPNGRSNKFADLYFSNSLPIMRCEWFDDPRKMEGAYRLQEDMEVGPVVLEAGSWWSPWAQSTREADHSDKLFAQEVLLSFEGLGGGFYDNLLGMIKHDQVRKPVFEGDLVLADEPGGRVRVAGMKERRGGFFASWEPCNQRCEWSPAMYLMGVDVATGSRGVGGRGASNSVVVVGRMEGDRVVKLAQYMVHGLMPHLFARVVAAIGWMFPRGAGRPAYVIWERNGPGETFGESLTHSHGYGGDSVYWASADQRPGFHVSSYRHGDGKLGGTKVNLYNNHLVYLEKKLYEEPSFQTYSEMECYRTTEDGGAEHIRRKTSLDPSESRENHGDSVVATVLMLWMARDLVERQEKYARQEELPRGSLASYMRQRRRELSAVWK